jgi:hypothetical protein
MANKGSNSHPYIEELTDSLIAVRENRRAAHFQNPKRDLIRRIRVDGGLITEGTRADYVISHPRIVDVIVELKGSDTARGIEQIRATYPVWVKHELAGKVIGALIVRSQGVHPKHQANIQRWITQMEMRHGMILLVETRNREYNFEEFLPRDNND